MIKPQDIVIILKILSKKSEPWTQNALAMELGMSPSEINGGLKRCVSSGLLRVGREQGRYKPALRAILEFLVHGMKYVFPATTGQPALGIPTSFAADLISEQGQGANGLLPVWPCDDGDVSGYSFQPLYRTVPEASRRDKTLYRYLVLVDALRARDLRYIHAAEDELSRMMGIDK